MLLHILPASFEPYRFLLIQFEQHSNTHNIGIVSYHLFAIFSRILGNICFHTFVLSLLTAVKHNIFILHNKNRMSQTFNFLILHNKNRMSQTFNLLIIHNKNRMSKTFNLLSLLCACTHKILLFFFAVCMHKKEKPIRLINLNRFLIKSFYELIFTDI